jgi:hypothetical protein
MWQDNDRFQNAAILLHRSRSVAVRLSFNKVEIFDLGPVTEESADLSGSVNQVYSVYTLRK